MKLSLVIPTYNEEKNIQKLIKKIQKEFKENKINGEIIIVDDNSPDKTGIILDSLKRKQKNLKIIHRKEKMGLSSAILEGWKAADGEILGVMDADLSHPPEKIKELFKTIENGAVDFVVGSRYVKNGKINGWSFKRKLISKSATLLARTCTKIKDPMSGFFMIKKECIEREKINSKGFKILLEIITKANYKKIKEIPIIFTNRVEGKSKIRASEIFYYFQNLSECLLYKIRKK